MLPDRLQDLIDRTSRLVAASAILEDRDFHLVAFASQSGELDRVRQASILERRSTPEVRAWFEKFGIARSDRPVRIPADPSLGILARVCLPARWNGVTYGYVWLLDENGDMPEGLLNEAMHEASRAGAMLAQQTRAREHTEQRLHDLLSPQRPAVEAAAEEIGALGLLDRRRPVVVIVLETVNAAEWRAAPLNMWRLPSHILLANEADHISLLTPDTGDVRELAARVRAMYAERLPPETRDGVIAGIGAARDDLADTRASWREARLAVRISREVRALRPVAMWNELGIYRLLACGPQRELRDAVIDPAVQRLLQENDHTLLTTARVYLDHAGSVQQAASALNIHRQTLYHRLEKIERLTGLDLADGHARLRLHLGITLAPLLAAAGAR